MSRDTDKPDSYAENAGILPYGSNISAPAISLPNTDFFKTERGSLARNYFEDRIRDLEEEYQHLQKLAQDTEAVYNANYNFVPRVGKTYHLYETDNGKILSLIGPDEWDQKHLGSFVFTHDSTWERK